jgi:hypothetical protein
MKMFRWICWLRGFHISWISFESLTRPETNVLKINGKTSPCNVCGKNCPDGIRVQPFLTWGEGK